MKFGLLFQLQTPRPADVDTWHQDDERTIIHQALEQIELADQLGYVWRQRPCTEQAAKPRLNVTPEPWRDFAHRSAELAARLTN